jgi:anti-anti-sigma factor
VRLGLVTDTKDRSEIGRGIALSLRPREVVMQVSKLDGVSVAVFGDDEFESPSLLEDNIEHLIDRSRHRKLVLDLFRVRALTSLGVALLVAAQGMAMICDTRLALARIQPGVRRSLELTGIDSVMSLHETVENARRALGPMSRSSVTRT